MVALGFLTPNNAPTPEVVKALSKDLESPAADKIGNTITLFHDELTFQACLTQWGMKSDHICLFPRAGVLESWSLISYVKKLGYLRLTDEEFENAKAKYPELKKKSYLQYGESKERY